MGGLRRDIGSGTERDVGGGATACGMRVEDGYDVRACVMDDEGVVVS